MTKEATVSKMEIVQREGIRDVKRTPVFYFNIRHRNMVALADNSRDSRTFNKIIKRASVFTEVLFV